MVTTTQTIEDDPRAAARDQARGRHATSPTDMPKRGWKDVLVRTGTESKADNIPLLSAGVAFFALLAIVPGLVVLASIYGLVADPGSVARHVDDLLGAAPVEVRNLANSQLHAIIGSSHRQLGIGLVVGLVVALWSASSGMKHLVAAINAAYDEDETRGFFRLRAVSLLLTLGGIGFVLTSIVVVAVLPSLLDRSPLGTAGRIAIEVLRWPALAIGLMVGLAVLYRFAPDRDEPRWRWVSAGAVGATVLWLAGSVLFSLYAANLGRYNETYGSLGAVIVVMLWLFLTALAVLLGAELNAELERQTVADSTRGRDMPLGARRAEAADTVGATAEELRTRKQAARRRRPKDEEVAVDLR